MYKFASWPMKVPDHLYLTCVQFYSQENYFMDAFPAVLPWCMSQNFNTRAFAQLTIIQMWETCKLHKLDKILDGFSTVQALIQFANSNRLACTSNI